MELVRILAASCAASVGDWEIHRMRLSHCRGDFLGSLDFSAYNLVEYMALPNGSMGGIMSLFLSMR